MSKNLLEIFVPQLEVLLASFANIQKQTKHHDFSDITADVVSDFLTRSMAALYRISGPSSQYVKQAEDVLQTFTRIYRGSSGPAISPLAGILRALKQDIEAGYIDSLEQLIHANLFADFLGMAQHLLEEGYKDPAAVLVGGTLEEHIRKLCIKNNIDIERTDPKGTYFKATDTLNNELVKAGVYSKLDQKSITAWLDLRNKAAHGRYDEYALQQVELFLQGVANFMTRYPA